MLRVAYRVGGLILILLLVSCATVDLGTTGIVRNVNHDRFQGGDLTVLTFNMLHGFGDASNDETLERRLALLAGELAQLHPDIVLLQEASITPETRHGNVADRLATELNRQVDGTGRSYNWVFFPAHGSQIIGFFEGSAILSQYEITDAFLFRYPTQARWPPEARIAVVATLARGEFAGGITAVSTHLTNVDALRAGESLQHHQASELAAQLDRWRESDGIVIIGGDFNAEPTSSAIAAMHSAGALDSWNGVDVPGSRRIDYVFTMGNVTILQTKAVLGRAIETEEGTPLRISDHPGVLVQLRLR